MLDIKVIRENPDRVKAAMKSRNADMDDKIDSILEGNGFEVIRIAPEADGSIDPYKVIDAVDNPYIISKYQSKDNIIKLLNTLYL